MLKILQLCSFRRDQLTTNIRMSQERGKVGGDLSLAPGGLENLKNRGRRWKSAEWLYVPCVASAVDENV